MRLNPFQTRIFLLVAIVKWYRLCILILVVVVAAQEEEEEERGGCFSNSKITAVT
jgi:hypothetical protein